MSGMRVLIPSLVCLLLLSQPLRGETVVYRGAYGSSIKIAGTSSVHDWEVACRAILGSMKMEGEFPSDPQAAEVPALPALPELKIQMRVRSLKSGTSGMDKVMHAAMKEDDHPVITFVLTSMAPSKKPRMPGDPLLYDTKGDLTVAGRKVEVTMPATVEEPKAGELLIKGKTGVKMTDFGIEPPAPRAAAGIIKTGDEVEIAFEWIARKAKPKN